MPARKDNVVRRSLFGSGREFPADEQPERDDQPPATRTLQQKTRSRQSSLPRAAQQPVEIAPASPPGRRAVERTAVTVPTDLLMQVKDAVAVLNGWPHQYTMARFVEEAFAAQLERLKVDHNGGREFPETNRKIRTGRPPGS